MKNLKITLGTIAAVTLAATPAMAHHAMGGEMPTTLAQGLLSGLAHPVIGVDHLVVIVAIGLFAGIKRQGLALPICCRWLYPVPNCGSLARCWSWAC
jgi:urease accessory protein